MADYDDLENEDLIAEDELDLLEGGRPESPTSNAIDNNDELEIGVGENVADTTNVEKKKRIVRNPQPKLDGERLQGPRGLAIMESWFKEVKFKGKGREKDDLDAVMGRLEQWTHRLFPKYTFDDALAKLEKLGHKSQVSTYVKKIRLGLEGEENLAPKVSDDEAEHVDDPFDALVADHNNSQSQISQSLDPVPVLTDEQRKRIMRNRLLAEERRMARLSANHRSGGNVARTSSETEK